MITDKEYPATHSMSTAWFCVDEDGNVGIFDIEDNGPVPVGGYTESCVEDVFWEDFSQKKGKYRYLDLRPEQLSQMLEKLETDDNWEENDGEWSDVSWMNVIIQIDLSKYDLLLKAYAMEIDPYHPLVCLSKEQGLFYVDFSDNKAGVDFLVTNDVIKAKYKAPQYEAPFDISDNEEKIRILHESAKYPLFLYLQDYWPFANPAIRLNNPHYPMKLEQLPKRIQSKIHKLPLKFKDVERIQLAELMPVEVSGCPEYVYDGKRWLLLKLSDGTNGYYCEKSHKLIPESVFKKYLDDGKAEEYDWDKHQDLKK